MELSASDSSSTILTQIGEKNQQQKIFHHDQRMIDLTSSTLYDKVYNFLDFYRLSAQESVWPASLWQRDEIFSSFWSNFYTFGRSTYWRWGLLFVIHRNISSVLGQQSNYPGRPQTGAVRSGLRDESLGQEGFLGLCWPLQAGERPPAGQSGPGLAGGQPQPGGPSLGQVQTVLHSQE